MLSHCYCVLTTPVKRLRLYYSFTVPQYRISFKSHRQDNSTMSTDIASNQKKKSFLNRNKYKNHPQCSCICSRRYNKERLLDSTLFSSPQTTSNNCREVIERCTFFGVWLLHTVAHSQLA